MLVKILGGIDLLAASIMISTLFGIQILTPLLLFSAGTLLLKSLFILHGEILSFGDLISAIVLILMIFNIYSITVVWMLSLFLMSKGIVSFL